MHPRTASLAVSAIALMASSFFAHESNAYPTLEGQPARYVIITADALAASFQPLADWKTQTGLPAVVRRMSDVIADHRVAFDDAERLRLEIRDGWQAGAQWVLLGGGAGVVPHRYGHTSFFGGRDILTDLYFQCLDGTWDADGDHVYGEGFLDSTNPGDNADLVADVWLGRAPVATPEEAQLFVAKTLQYQRTPAGDYEHLSLECAEVLFPQVWNPGDPLSFDGADLVEPLLPYFDLHPALHVARLYENHTNPAWRPGALPENPAAVRDSMNLGTNQTLIVGLGSIHDVSVGPGLLNESDFLGLTNGGRLAILRTLGSAACQFDSGGIGRAALLAPAGGAASVIGGSDFQFPTSARVMMTEYYRLIYQDGVNAQGEANSRSVLPFLPFASYDGVTRWSIMTQLLLGDPELRTYTGPLRTLTVQHSNHAFVNETSFTVTVLSGADPVEGARVAAWSAGQFLGIETTNAGGVATVPISPTGRGSFLLTVTAPDSRAYEASVRIVGNPSMRRLPASAAPLEPAEPARELALRVRGSQLDARAPEVELTLVTGAPARLEVLDVAGRRLASRDIEGFRPGALGLRLNEVAGFAPGVYMLRLTQGRSVVSARMALLR